MEKKQRRLNDRERGKEPERKWETDQVLLLLLLLQMALQAAPFTQRGMLYIYIEGDKRLDNIIKKNMI